MFREHFDDFIPGICSAGNCDGTIEIDIDDFVEEFTCETKVEDGFSLPVLSKAFYNAE
jgi:hypothetical protein